jgi:putative membrane protein
VYPTENVPYCGTPPIPGELWQNWNLDPVLIAVLLVAVGTYAVGASRSDARAVEHWRHACFYAGWGMLVAMLVSPLCNLTVALFSARVGQHMVLTLVAAPLLMLGRPQEVLGALRRQQGKSPISGTLEQTLGRASIAGLLFAGFMWLWHAPAPYDATLTSNVVYWAMHLTLIGSALLLWHVILTAGAAGRLQGVLTCVASSMQMGLLGAIITLAPRALYDSHAATTLPWGLTSLEDQQLGGLIMWVPGGAVFLVAALALAASALASMDARRDPLLR